MALKVLKDMLRLAHRITALLKCFYVDLYFRLKYPFVARIHKKSALELFNINPVDFTYNRIVSDLYLPNTYFSEFGQDFYLSSLLMNYIRYHHQIWVVDVGAGEPEFLSNSLYFETYYGCKTLAIDALDEYKSQWEKERPAATFVCSAIGSKKGNATLIVPNNGNKMFSYILDGQDTHTDNEFSKRKVPVDTLSHVLNDKEISSIMLLLIDVNGCEFEVLKGIDFSRVNIKSIVLENKTESYIGSETIRTFLISKNYVFVSRISNNDDVFLHQSMINGIPDLMYQSATTI